MIMAQYNSDLITVFDNVDDLDLLLKVKPSEHNELFDDEIDWDEDDDDDDD